MAVRVPRHLRSRDPAVIAPIAGLRYLPPDVPGWTRRRRGKGFSYLDERGDLIGPPRRDRLCELAVPPAWDDVWLSPAPDGHLQATGIDGAGRKQYRYHDEYRALSEARKFARLRYFGRALPLLRSYINDALTAPMGSRTLAVGAVLGVIDEGLVRVGNRESAEDGHYGATTLIADHVGDDGHVVLEYPGKGGKLRTVVIEDEQLGDILGSLAEHADEQLFRYRNDDGVDASVSAAEINAVIASVAGPAFSAKDFRTWGGSRRVLEARAEGQERLASVDAAAETLGNTRAVARSSYVHPIVLEASDADIASVWAGSRRSEAMSRSDSALRKLLAPPASR